MCCRASDLENGCFRPPPKKNMAIFLPENGLKMPILGQNSAFSDRVVNLTPPNLFLQVIYSKQHVLQVQGRKKRVFQGRPH